MIAGFLLTPLLFASGSRGDVSLTEDPQNSAPTGPAVDGSLDTPPPSATEGPTLFDPITDNCGPNTRYYSVNLRYGDGRGERRSTDRILNGAAANLDCLRTLVDDCTETCRDLYGNGTMYTDDCVAMAVGMGYMHPATESLTPCTDGGMGWSPRATARYIDGNCNFSATADPSEVCNDFEINWFYSPISFLWNEASSIHETGTLTQFPLDPKRPGRWFLWKGSASAPLLVYDPKHAQKIDSAAQLFGNNTFGKEWENGYQALATLDKDNNGEISGDELDPLALWFDANRDAIADSGEVQTLTKLNVLKVFYLPNRVDDATHDVIATRGFQFKSGDKVVTGSSVDWFSNSYASQSEAISVLPRATSSIDNNTIDRAGSDVNEIAGAWEWKIDGDSAQLAPKGILTFDSNNKILRGHSLINTPLKRNKDDVSSMLTMAPFEGSAIRNPGGTLQIEFEVRGADGSTTKSKARLSADGRTMQGTSTIKVKVDSSRETSVPYSWTARRL